MRQSFGFVKVFGIMFASYFGEGKKIKLKKDGNRVGGAVSCGVFVASYASILADSSAALVLRPADAGYMLFIESHMFFACSSSSRLLFGFLSMFSAVVMASPKVMSGCPS